jgi:hypothetical protein
MGFPMAYSVRDIGVPEAAADPPAVAMETETRPAASIIAPIIDSRRRVRPDIVGFLSFVGLEPTTHPHAAERPILP